MTAVELAKTIQWRTLSRMSMVREHSSLSRAEYKGRGLQRESFTPVNKYEEFGIASVYYFIDGLGDEFKTCEAMCAALLKLEEMGAFNNQQARSG